MSEPVQLKIIVIGAGLAGLAVAVALRQAGHPVEIFEQSPRAAELGAAIGAAPNGCRVLDYINFDYKKARAVQVNKVETRNAFTLETVREVDLNQNYSNGGRHMHMYRPDFHTELKRLALEGEETPQAVLREGSRVVAIDPEAGSITLQDGTTHTADLIIAADGINSTARELVTGTPVATTLEHIAYRFMLPTAAVLAEPALAAFYAQKVNRFTAFTEAGMIPPESKRRVPRTMTWWSCRDAELQNLGFFMPAANLEDLNASPLSKGLASKELVQQEFEGFHPSLLSLINLSDSIMQFPVSWTDPLASFVRAKLVLIGDAAHAMHPRLGQGLNQGLEDAGALAVLLRDLPSPTSSPLTEISALLPARLALYNRLRVPRAAIASRASRGKHPLQDAASLVGEWAAGTGLELGEGATVASVLDWLQGSDVIAETEALLAAESGSL